MVAMLQEVSFFVSMCLFQNNSKSCEISFDEILRTNVPWDTKEPIAMYQSHIVQNLGK